MLTKKQYELLLLIDTRIREAGVPPSFDEMKMALGLKSKSGIHRLISGLEERGFIRRLPHRARALEILKMPENIERDRADSKAQAAQVTAEKPSSMANVVKGEFGAKPIPAHTSPAAGIELPFLGRIAAGTPIEALSDPSSFIEVPPSMLGGGDHFCLEVDGDSMIEAGILDGDTVIIQRTNHTENGAIVVALVDNEEATLKYIHKKGDKVALKPANAAYETRIFGPDRVHIQGRLVGLLRKF
ncbi:transcriptional repressor LexA [Magnetovibrio blakemorei]|uniref:LexA repressor n=1 Tax=Magnetovibrio blakemorei TaxID=28181 RepID=A0A1E5Q920_9PROT|nr:transcriptional repressor LexA [Magnetovibrio blakemorei]OEJ67999.1 repressor LexA [Magnetovibrio blakemorei]